VYLVDHFHPSEFAGIGADVVSGSEELDRNFSEGSCDTSFAKNSWEIPIDGLRQPCFPRNGSAHLT
jgi:hypothetical protein